MIPTFLQIHSTTALYLIALGLAGILMVLARTQKELKCFGCQVIAYIVLIFALAGIIFSVYLKYCCMKSLSLTASCPVISLQVNK